MSETGFRPERRGIIALAGLGMTIGVAAAARPHAAGGGESAGLAERDAAVARLLPEDGNDYAKALGRAFRSLAVPPVSPPGRQGWGVGAVQVPRGAHDVRGAIDWGGSPLGFGLIGAANYATTLTFHLSTGAAIPLRTYVGVRIQDMFLRNMAGGPGDSVAIDLDGTGGGAELTIKRVAIENFHTGIRTNGAGSTPGNGDKTLVEQVQFHTDVGFDNTRNKQAIGWTFLNCASGCEETMFKLGGAGEVAVLNQIGDVYGSLIQLPEASGNPGSGNYLGCRATVMSSKLEYHGAGPRMLLDARASLLNTDSGGSNADIVFRDVSIASGSAAPDPTSHVIMQVGDGVRGSDAVRVRQDGGWIEGVVRLGSAHPGPVNRRWAFRDAVRAPDPGTVRLEGTGNHPLLEWRHNENVPVDQYRGGEAFTGAIDAQKAFLWRHDGRRLVNTGVSNDAFGDRRGGQFTIGGFPRNTTFLGMAVLIAANRGGTDTLIEWFADRGFSRLLARALIPAGQRGLRPVAMNGPASWQTASEGEVHVRITKPAGGDDGTEGALVLFYFPYPGV